MRKSTVIARCMMNSGVSSLDEGELAVRTTFQEEFPTASFEEWNLDISDAEGEEMVSILGERYKLLRIAEPRVSAPGISSNSSSRSGGSKRRSRKARKESGNPPK
jgi:hypothetical protein